MHLVTHTHTHTQTRERSPLDGESARRRDIYLAKHNTQKEINFHTLAELEPTILADERPQTYALERVKYLLLLLLQMQK